MNEPGISQSVALVIEHSKLDDASLDPHAFDDAAVIVRAETLVLEGVDVAEAIYSARVELARSRS